VRVYNWAGMRAWVPILVVAAVLAGCSDEADPAPRAASEPAATAEPAPEFDGRCPVTLPNGEVPDDAEGFNHGNGSLAVALWPKGRIPAGELPDGSLWASINPDGSIEAKLGWWRVTQGLLRIEGDRLDAEAPPLTAHVPRGYGNAGFQPTGIRFPTEGCWRVVGHVSDASLAFVARVFKLKRAT
jgi:hypothetical protein